MTDYHRDLVQSQSLPTNDLVVYRKVQIKLYEARMCSRFAKSIPLTFFYAFSMTWCFQANTWHILEVYRVKLEGTRT